MQAETYRLFGRCAVQTDPKTFPSGRVGAKSRGPCLEAGPLTLRPHVEEDFPDFLELMRDPMTFRYSGRGVMNEEEAWSRLLRHVGHWTLKGWGLFAVVEKASCRLVGEAGLNHFHRGFGPDFDEFPEASWTIKRTAQGLGHATAAAEAALDWAERALGFGPTVCMIQPGNLASLRVAEKLGYLRFRDLMHDGRRALLLRRPGARG